MDHIQTFCIDRESGLDRIIEARANSPFPDDVSVLKWAAFVWGHHHPPQKGESLWTHQNAAYVWAWRALQRHENALNEEEVGHRNLADWFQMPTEHWARAFDASGPRPVAIDPAAFRRPGAQEEVRRLVRSTLQEIKPWWSELSWNVEPRL